MFLILRNIPDSGGHFRILFPFDSKDSIFLRTFYSATNPKNMASEFLKMFLKNSKIGHKPNILNI